MDPKTAKNNDKKKGAAGQSTLAHNFSRKARKGWQGQGSGRSLLLCNRCRRVLDERGALAEDVAETVTGPLYARCLCPLSPNTEALPFRNLQVSE